MSAPFWVHELAGRFWEQAGEDGNQFPRDLRLPIARAFPLSPVGMAELRVRSIDRWLADGEIACAIGGFDRPLRACLVAYGGCGLLFHDTGDSDVEQRFSLAHELAHFLYEYVEPRRLAVERLGMSVLSVLDGERDASTDEQLRGLLAGVPLGFMVHLMDRSDEGEMSSEVSMAERNADVLAFELLAPEERVRKELEAAPGAVSRASAVAVLREVYGLPASVAGRYASALVEEAEPSTVVKWLRLVK
jgi:hypothetical protein